VPAVATPTSTMEASRTGRRPHRSLKAPRTMPPIGRATKPAANAPKVPIVAALPALGGKNSGAKTIPAT
jgi:hypothetical protein